MLKNVLLLHTGGTLGMRGDPLVPDDYAADLADSVPELRRLAQLQTQIICNLDSSDVGPAIWSQLARRIDEAREQYDGFVVVHGTDTMAYTASALAFALRGLDRPVVLTGAQRPLAALRTDARRNLADAVTLATCAIPEVGICFDGLLMRGCRTTKSNGHDYRGFESPGCEPLARLGVDVALSEHVRHPSSPFECHPSFDAGVLVVHVTPGMSAAMLEAQLLASDTLRGIVLVAFGMGTIPTRHDGLAPALKRAIDAGVDVVVITPSTGAVDLMRYANSRELAEIGAISGGKMRLEAATTKLMHALASYPDRAARRRYLEWNVAGELA